jgi:hypothetical protein
VNALEVITDAYQRCNRLSPGESLGGDDIERGFTRLNLLVDEWAADSRFLFQDVLTSAAQTGNITLGTGSWAAIAPGTTIVSAVSNNLPLSPITMAQYSQLVTQTGTPSFYVQDGLSNVYLYPSPTGQTIQLQTTISVAEFADTTTEYTVPPGYKSALGAALAVRIAPFVLGKLPPELERAERAAMSRISSHMPSIVNTYSYTGYRPVGNILNGW